jgi:hypothetical protein
MKIVQTPEIAQKYDALGALLRTMDRAAFALPCHAPD